jgi:hypothetical protein
MSDAAATVEAGKIDIGRVIGETFGVLRRNFVTFLVLSLIMSGVPTALFVYAQASMYGSAGAFNSDFVMWWLMGMLVFMITATVLQATLIHTTVQDLNGKKATVAESLAVGLRAFLPLIGLGILFSLGIMLGFLLLIVPGIMLLVAWFVAVPAFIADRTSITGAFGRSAQLTRGNRWRIFGLLVMIYVIILVLSLVVGAVTGIGAINAGADPAAYRDLQTSPLAIAVNVISQTITGMITSAGVAVLYVELRRAREGLGPQSLADVFG